MNARAEIEPAGAAGRARRSRVLGLLAAVVPVDAPRLAVSATIEPSFELADHAYADVVARAGLEIVLVGAEGEVRTAIVPGEGAPVVGGTLALPEPRRAIFALAPLEPDRPPALFVASPRGLAVHRAGADGAFAAEPAITAPRARFRLRTGVPRAAPLAIDVDGDGRTDAVVPDGESLDVWLQRPATPEGVAFTRGATVRVPVSISRSTGSTALSDRYESGITIPDLRRLDVNGDGRLDVVVEDRELRAFHLVRADGSIPAEPDAVLDLAIFKDTTAEGGLAPGRTLAGLDRTLHEMRDVDGDGIPDHVVAHRRKVWVFRGTREAPGFQTPSSVLKTADDVTALLLLDLDADRRPDLVLLRVLVPSVGAILRGLVSEWEVEVAAVGYRAGGERDFEPTPKWRSTLRFRVPAILSILKDPEAIVRRFEDAGAKLAGSAEGDVDGDGREDALLLSEDGARLSVWLGDEQSAAAARETPAEIVRQALFAESEATWDLDRLVAWFAGVAERRVRAATGGREPLATLELRQRAAWSLVRFDAADLDGDGRDEVVLRYDEVGGTRSVLDVVHYR